MNRRSVWRAASLAASFCIAAGVSIAGSGSAHADAVPFTDPAATGVITLCDQSGNPVTSGKLADKPFVARVVSSVPAPAGYRTAQHGQSTLYAYQPIDGYSPADWSGMQLNASSVFSTDAHPMTDSTILDYSMGEFAKLYPPKWDDLVQLRMFYSAPNRDGYLQSYPATVLKVEGDSWRVVSGAGPDDCTKGTSTTTEKIVLSPKQFASASAVAVKQIAAQQRTNGSGRGGGAHAGGTGGSRGGPGGETTSAPTPGAPAPVRSGSSAASTGSAGEPVDAAHESAAHADSGTSSWPIIVIAAVAVLGIGGALWLRRRRHV